MRSERKGWSANIVFHARGVSSMTRLDPTTRVSEPVNDIETAAVSIY